MIKRAESAAPAAVASGAAIYAVDEKDTMRTGHKRLLVHAEELGAAEHRDLVLDASSAVAECIVNRLPIAEKGDSHSL